MDHSIILSIPTSSTRWALPGFHTISAKSLLLTVYCCLRRAGGGCAGRQAARRRRDLIDHNERHTRCMKQGAAWNGVLESQESYLGTALSLGPGSLFVHNTLNQSCKT